jgi:hypothetical protein
VYRDEPFFSQDRLDVLLWRLQNKRIQLSIGLLRESIELALEFAAAYLALAWALASRCRKLTPIWPRLAKE